MPEEINRTNRRLEFWIQRKENLLKRKFTAIPFGSFENLESQQLSYRLELELLDQLIENCLQLLDLYESAARRFY